MRKLLIRLLKAYWFPLAVLILGLLGRKYDWAKSTHEVLRKVK